MKLLKSFSSSFINMQFTINSSEAAACIARNPYQERDDLVLRYLKTYSPSAYINYSKRTGEKTLAEKVTQLKRKLESTHQSVAKSLREQVNSTLKAVEGSSNYSDKVVASVNAVQEQLGSLSNYTIKEKQLIQEEMRKQMYTTIGSKKEKNVLDDMENITIKRGYCTRYVIDAYTPKGDAIKVYLGGKVDAFQTDSNGECIIVEVKNRMRRLFGCVVDYEYVQVMCYMFIHNLKKAKLIERFQNETKEHTVNFDNDQWTQIVKGIVDFAQDVFRLAHENDDVTETDQDLEEF